MLLPSRGKAIGSRQENGALPHFWQKQEPDTPSHEAKQIGARRRHGVRCGRILDAAESAEPGPCVRTLHEGDLPPEFRKKLLDSEPGGGPGKHRTQPGYNLRRAHLTLDTFHDIGGLPTAQLLRGLAGHADEHVEPRDKTFLSCGRHARRGQG